MKPKLPRGRASMAVFLASAAGIGALFSAGAAGAASFLQTNLVTDSQAYLASAGFSPAATQDPSLINPWGMDHTATGAWFIANTGDEGSSSGKASGAFYTGAGVKQSSAVIPQTAVGPMGAGAPTGATGVVYNPSTSQFVIANLDGHLSTLNFGSTVAVQTAIGPTPAMGPPHSIYTGVTIGTVGGATDIYAANNATGGIDVYGPNFQPVSFGAGAFQAPAVAAGLAAYDVQNLGGDIWVTYAIPGPASAGAPLGSGAVAEFTSTGQLIKAFSDPLHMSSPWALAIAPTGFGAFSGDLLVGNFSHDDDPALQDAFINAYNPTTGAYVGTLDDAKGNPILLPGLWQIDPGNNGDAGSSANLYFSAGIGDEQHGLFGFISSGVPEPATWGMMIAGFGGIGLSARRRRRRLAILAA
jgi:uncharacterized protein (TIGR03118 family)